MSIERMILRFSKANKTDRHVAAYLANLDTTVQSRNRQVIDLLAAAIESTEKEQADTALVERIRQVFREEVQAVPVLAGPPAVCSFATELTAEEETRNAASVLADLEMFG